MDVFGRWLAGQDKGGETVSCRGGVIYSYSMAICAKAHGIVMVVSDGPTQTTKIHLSNVRQSLYKAEIPYVDATREDVRSPDDVSVKRMADLLIAMQTTGGYNPTPIGWLEHLQEIGADDELVTEYEVNMLGAPAKALAKLEADRAKLVPPGEFPYDLDKVAKRKVNKLDKEIKAAKDAVLKTQSMGA